MPTKRLTEGTRAKPKKPKNTGAIPGSNGPNRVQKAGVNPGSGRMRGTIEGPGMKTTSKVRNANAVIDARVTGDMRVENGRDAPYDLLNRGSAGKRRASSHRATEGAFKTPQASTGRGSIPGRMSAEQRQRTALANEVYGYGGSVAGAKKAAAVRKNTGNAAGRRKS